MSVDFAAAYWLGEVMDAEVAYFITDCAVLTDTLKQQIARQFLTTLQSHGVCRPLSGNQATCNVGDVTFHCGQIVEHDPLDRWGFVRRKRSSDEQNELAIKFRMTVPPTKVFEAYCSKL